MYRLDKATGIVTLTMTENDYRRVLDLLRHEAHRTVAPESFMAFFERVHQREPDLVIPKNEVEPCTS